MTQKRVLNTTSRKKRDTMLAYAQTNGSAGGGASGPAQFSGATGYQVFLWHATGRDNTYNTSGNPGSVFNDAVRTSSTCFMRGLKETVEIQTSTGIPWQWRRICFTVKGFNFTGSSIETSYGWQRMLYNINSGSSTDTATYNSVLGVLFKGQSGIDWNTPQITQVDTSRVTLKYDRTFMVSSGNSSGVLRKYNIWMPMNKNLVYDDDEQGEQKATRIFSVDSRAGMGDYYVIDFFFPGIGASSSDAISFNPAATLYWHEK